MRAEQGRYRDGTGTVFAPTGTAFSGVPSLLHPSVGAEKGPIGTVGTAFAAPLLLHLLEKEEGEGVRESCRKYRPCRPCGSPHAPSPAVVPDPARPRLSRVTGGGRRYPFEGARIKHRTAAGLDAEARDRLAHALTILNTPSISHAEDAS